MASGCRWDDERGDYQAAAGDHLAFRYEVVAKIGSGSFGLVPTRCKLACAQQF